MFNKVNKYSKSLSDRLKVYVSFLIDSLFVNKETFTLRLMQEIHELMEDEIQRNYIYNIFLITKSFIKFSSNHPFRNYPESQINNFSYFFRKIFENEKKRSKPNDYLMYNLLRFSSLVEIHGKLSLIERMRDFPMIDKEYFWKFIFEYMSKNIYNHLNNNKKQDEENTKSSGSSNFIKTFGNLFKKRSVSVKKTEVKASNMKAYQEISALLFRIGIDFDSIVDILLHLAKSAEIKINIVNNTLQRNKDVLYKQLQAINMTKLELKTLNKLKIERSYMSELRIAKGLPARSSSVLKVLADPKTHILLRNIDDNTQKKILKLYEVLKLTLPFLCFKTKKTSIISPEEEIEEEGIRIRTKLIKNKPDLEQRKVKKTIIIDEEESKDILTNARSLDIGTDDLLEEASRISQTSIPSTPKKKKKINTRLQIMKEKYRDKEQIESELNDVLNVLMICKEMMGFKNKVLKNILHRIWPLNDNQRKGIYLELINNSLRRDALIEYEPNSYVFEKKKSDHNILSPKKSEKRQFGESFMVSRTTQKRGSLIQPLGNDFNPINNSDTDNMSDNEDKKEITRTSIINTLAKLKEHTEKNEEDNIEEPELHDNSIVCSERSNNNPFLASQEEESGVVLRKGVFRRKRNKEENSLPTKSKKTKLKTSEQKDNIISLDVKRTHIEKTNFDHVALEQILRNISHSKMGSFSYYQGLNYITAYFLDMIENPIDTYNVIITILENYFRKYVNANMENLKVLFYILKRLIQIFLPEIFTHIENSDSLETNVIFANWILTIFTTLKQHCSSIPLLNQILDIFIAKGWPGFFRCILVIFYYLEEELLTMDSEKLIMLMTDFPKQSFSRLGEKVKEKDNREFEFNFKIEIKMFKAIDNLLIQELSMEFYRLEETFEKKWQFLKKRLDKYPK